jgi:hypothetical protein
MATEEVAARLGCINSVSDREREGRRPRERTLQEKLGFRAWLPGTTEPQGVTQKRRISL